MSGKLSISMIQMGATSDRPANLARAQSLIEQAIATTSPRLVVLPEYFQYYGGADSGRVQMAESVPGGQASEMLSELARRHAIYIHGGSLLERSEVPGKAYNTSVVFGPDGREITRYRKIHLFDATTTTGAVYAESNTIVGGSQFVLYEIGLWKIGCAICFDLRFSGLFDALAEREADLIVLPAAFTPTTGEAHWEVLVRSRAIETQTYFAACAQWGAYESNGQQRSTYGNSMICDPWGGVLTRLAEGEGVVSATLDYSHVKEARARIPMRAQKRIEAGQVSAGRPDRRI